MNGSCQQLLLTPTSTAPRKTAVYDGKQYEIPVKGDILYVEDTLGRTRSRRYALVLEVARAKKDLIYFVSILKPLIEPPRRHSDFILERINAIEGIFPLRNTVKAKIMYFDQNDEGDNKEEGDNAEEEEDIVRLDKVEAGYIDPPPKRRWPAKGRGIRCGTCVYFSDEGKCAIVEGDIHGQGCCNLWTDESNQDVSDFLSAEDIEDILRDNPYWKGGEQNSE